MTICIFTAATSPADELGGEEREEAEKDMSRRSLSLCLLILRMFAHRLSCGWSGDLSCLVFWWEKIYSRVKKSREWLEDETDRGGEEEKQERRAVGGRPCHQSRRVMVGEVKIKAHRRRLAPQPRLNPLPCPSVVLVTCVCVCVCVCVGWVGGEWRVRDISGVCTGESQV